jgi:DNA-binding XRE family transcriptional regulator
MGVHQGREVKNMPPKLSPKRIRKLRVRAGLSQPDLADKVGVSEI